MINSRSNFESPAEWARTIDLVVYNSLYPTELPWGFFLERLADRPGIEPGSIRINSATLTPCLPAVNCSYLGTPSISCWLPFVTSVLGCTPFQRCAFVISISIGVSEAFTRLLAAASPLASIIRASASPCAYSRRARGRLRLGGEVGLLGRRLIDVRLHKPFNSAT